MDCTMGFPAVELWQKCMFFWNTASRLISHIPSVAREPYCRDLFQAIAIPRYARNVICRLETT